MPGNKDAFRIGAYYLGRRRNSADVVRLPVDPRTRQKVGRSLGTEDFQAAQIELARFVTRQGEIRNVEPSRMTVAQLLERHHERHVKPAAKADFARHSRRLLEHFGDAMIADLTPVAMEGFTSAMRATGRGGSYTDRILDSLRSALSKAHKLGEITTAPVHRDRAA